MRALVTGGSGFVGSGLIAELSARGGEVYALMRKSSSSENLAGLRFERREGDLRDEASLRSAVRGVDVIYHVAGVVTAPNREAFFEHNALGAGRLARIAAEECPELKRFVLVSSLAAGGPSTEAGPRTEGQEDRPVSTYGESKLEGEKQVLQFADRIPITVLRPPMVYGPRDKATFLFVKTAKGGISPAFRKFYTAIHVDDLVAGIAEAGLGVGLGLKSGEMLYLTSEQVFSYDQMMGAIASALGKRMVKVPVPMLVLQVAAWSLDGLGKITGRTYPLNRDKLNEILPDYWTCSGEKARGLLGFRAKHTIESGWADAVSWYRKSGWISE